MLARIGALLTTFVLTATPIAAATPDGFDLQAHRGGRGETTEESLRAFAKAIELGVTTLELDIVLSKDGAPMVWHDPTIQPDKCTDTGPAFPGDPQYPYVGKLVHDLTQAQLHALNCGRLLSGFPAAEVVTGNKIATLGQVFALAESHRADVRYNIETKIDPTAPERGRLAAAGLPPLPVPVAVGCAACGGVGHRGRTVLAEVHAVDDGLRDLVTTGAPLSAWRAHVVASGVSALSAQAARAVGAGRTTFEEIQRVLGWR